MELQIRIKNDELRQLVANGALLKILELSSMEDKDDRGEFKGQLELDCTNPDKPTIVAPVTSEEVGVTEIPVSKKTYSRDEIAKAAVELMDSGQQDALMTILAKYGVESLPELTDEQLDGFVSELRVLGANI